MLILAGSGTGCLGTALRAATDPSSLAADAGREAAAHSLSGLMTPQEIDTAAATERMVSDLRRIAADNAGAANRGELSALADQLDARLKQSSTATGGGQGRAATGSVAHPWVVDLPGVGRAPGGDAFPSVHLLRPAGNNGLILSMKSRLYNPSGLGRLRDRSLLDTATLGAPRRADYSAGGWGEEPPPDRLLSSPPPPPE